MIHDRFGAMGTQIEAYGRSADGLDRVHSWFAEAEAACSRFLPDSELSRVNGSGGPSRVSALLADALRAADLARRITGGLVDAGIGERVTAWGYDRTFAEVTGRAAAPGPGPAGTWQMDGRVVHLGEGVRLDLGGSAKGWACDRAVERGDAVVVSAGGDLRSDDPGTVVDVLGSDGSRLAVVPVGRGALATSSAARRVWTVAGRRVSHVIDPRSGAPVDGPVVGATVTADTAVKAEAGAKAVLLLGVDGLAWADRQDWIRSALVEWHDGSVYAIEETAA